MSEFCEKKWFHCGCSNVHSTSTGRNCVKQPAPHLALLAQTHVTSTCAPEPACAVAPSQNQAFSVKPSHDMFSAGELRSKHWPLDWVPNGFFGRFAFAPNTLREVSRILGMQVAKMFTVNKKEGNQIIPDKIATQPSRVLIQVRENMGPGKQKSL